MTFGTPMSLPQIDAVAIVILRGIEMGRGGFMPYAQQAPFVKVHGSEAIRIASLWRALPLGKQARCHIPPFGLRFFQGDLMLCEASLCWQCNNIWGNAGESRFGYQFDGSDLISRELLAACQQAFNIPKMK